MRVADVQRPHIGHQVAPGRDLDLDAQFGQDRRHVGDGLLQRQVLARDKGLLLRIGLNRKQGLRVGVQVVHRFNDESGARLNRLFDRATIDGPQDALAVLVGHVGRQLHLNLDGLQVAVVGVHDVVLRQANVLGGDIAGLAVQLHKIRRTQSRGGQKIIERTGRRAIALVTNRLIRQHGEVVKLGLQAQFVEKIDFDFHAVVPGELRRPSGRQKIDQQL